MTNIQEKTIFVTITLLVLVFPTALGANIFERFLKAKSCSFTIATNFPDKEPVLVISTNEGYELIEPENDAVLLKVKEEVVISCPGARNTIVAIGDNIATAKCVDGQTLTVAGKQYLLSELGCSTTVTGEVNISTTKCGGTRGGVIKSIGHVVNGEFLSLFEVCYDDKKGEALYADHILYGSSINYSKPGSGRPSFKVGGLAPGVSADNAYKQTTQKVTFSDILGSDELASQYIKANSYLARGHLAPDGDFIFGSSQFSSYFYINTVPQWQAVNNGNWKSLEFSVRSVASAAETNFRVITGGHKVLSLEDVNENEAEIYLATNNKLPVPKFVWKILYSLETSQAIAFVSLNNPFVEEVTEDDYLCKDICETNGWGTAAWDNPAKGLVYCCSVSDLKKEIKTIPALKVSGVLQGKNTKSLARKVLEVFGL